MSMPPVTTRPAGSARAVAAVAGAVATAVAAGFIVGTWRSAPWPVAVWIPIQVAGLSFVFSGTALWLRRPANGTGRLMVAVGVTWYLGELQLSANPILYAVGFCLFYLNTAFMGHLVLALPTGRLHLPHGRWLLVSLYAAPVVTQLVRLVAEYPPEAQVWGDTGGRHSVWAPIGSVVIFLGTAGVLLVLARRWAAAGPAARREWALVWLIIAAMGAAVTVTAVVGIVSRAPHLLQLLATVYATGLIALPVAIAGGILRIRLARVRIAELVVRLETAATPEELRAALARALDDPSLEIFYPRPGGCVDADGRPMPPATPDRARQAVGDADHPIALLAVDPDVAGQKPLVEAVVAAARLALDNARLVAEQRAALAEVRDSQRRIVIAADSARHRIQRDLHDGAQHDLLALSMLISRARGRLTTAADPELTADLDLASGRLRQAIEGLRHLVEEIHPPTLTEQGLGAALETMAERAPLPVVLRVPDRRLPEHLERAAYFVIAEALANVYKHACADSALVRVSRADGRLVVSVCDDGVGGADPTQGSGLRGLRDRVTALAGSLQVHSIPGAGTTVMVELPCE